MILQSIGDNVASGLGILGALTIINFRTNFKDPRDIIFMFASLGVGIACGSYVFAIAIIGTSMFCLLAFSLKFTNFSLGNHVIWVLKLRHARSIPTIEIENILRGHCKRFALEGLRNLTVNEIEAQDRDYLVALKNEKHYELLMSELRQLGVEVKRFIHQNSETLDI